MKRLHDVAIVGCGPVGATLANLLALRGVDVLVVEREADIYGLPRAIHFDGECMRVFQSVGIADALVGNVVVSPGMKFVDAAGRLLIDWSRPTCVGSQGWHPSYRFHQPALEEMLRHRLRQWPNAELRTEHEVCRIEQRRDEVELEILDRSNGHTKSIAARYVVGCDGARSIVRRSMGSGLDDLQSHERWLVVDLILERDRPDLGDHSIQFCDPARPATYVRGVGLRRRWEFMLFPDEDSVAMTRPEAIWNLLARWIGPDEGMLERPAVYTFHAVVARGWRKGRLLIAGDAAHQTPPFMGQGMCAGIRDASNLAWKLADVLADEADATLLATYESERSPHVREFIETAVRLGRIIQTVKGDPPAASHALLVERPEVFATPQPRLGPGMHDGREPAGTIGEQGWTSAGQRLDDAVGYQAALVIDPAHVASAPRFGPEVTMIPSTSPSLRAWLLRLDAVAILVRPDRYIAGIARNRAELATLSQWAVRKEHRSTEASAGQ